MLARGTNSMWLRRGVGLQILAAAIVLWQATQGPAGVFAQAPEATAAPTNAPATPPPMNPEGTPAPSAVAPAASPAGSGTPAVAPPTGFPELPPTSDEEEEDSKGGELAKARKAIREGHIEEGLTILKSLRAANDRRPAIAYWIGIAYQRLGLLELAWRELHQASLYQPANRAYSNALRTVERTLVTGVPQPGLGPAPQQTPGTPLPTATPFPPTPTLTPRPPVPDETLEPLRYRAERAMRNGHDRLAVGLAQEYLRLDPNSVEVILFGVDAAIRANAAVAARRFFEMHPQKMALELVGLRERLWNLEAAAPKYQPTGTPVEKAKTALDALLVSDAMELLESARVQSPQDPEILRLLASGYTLRGQEHVARAFIEEAASHDPSMRRYLERPELLEEPVTGGGHQAILEPLPPGSFPPSPTPVRELPRAVWPGGGVTPGPGGP